jgi:hypothetical protein
LAHWVRQVLGFGFGFLVCLAGGFEVGLVVFGFFDGVRGLLVVPHASPLCGAAPTFLCRGKEK